jgi:hypothetical protein
LAIDRPDNTESVAEDPTASDQPDHTRVVAVTSGGGALSTLIRRTSGAVSIPSGVQTVVPFQSVLYDDVGAWDVANPTRLTAPSAGLYLITARVAWPSDTAGSRRAVIFSPAFFPYAQNWASAFSTTTLPVVQECVDVRKLSAGDILELYVFQDSGTAYNLSLIANSYPIMTLTRLD